MLPSSVSTVPANIFRSVDLPEPLGPIRPMRSPSETVNDTFWKSGFAPKALEICWVLMLGEKKEFFFCLELGGGASRPPPLIHLLVRKSNRSRRPRFHLRSTRPMTRPALWIAPRDVSHD